MPNTGILQVEAEQIENEPHAIGVLPWVSAPYRLVSWYDMEKFAAEKYWNIASNLGSLTFQIAHGTHATTVIGGSRLATTISAMAELRSECEAIGLKVAALQIEDTLERLNDRENLWTAPQIGQLIIAMSVAIKSEMSTHLFLRVLPERQDFYEQPDLFGKSVADNFSSASSDIQQSGSCYAADRSTACVMHLMRVLELGLNALANKLDVRFERREWENIINEIEAEIKKINGPHAGTDWREQQKFYSEAAKDFRYFKNAWRNHAMHQREYYDAPEARMIFDHVKSFMAHLADNGLKEKS